MDKIFHQVLLYDFYGELLTPHQQSIYEDAVCNDMSLGEIAQEQGISRQGVHDLIKRCDRILQDYESKLHLVERFALAKEKISEIERLTRLDEKEERENGHDRLCEVQERMERIRSLSRELLKEL
nr:DNA-binding protein [uncultured Acetatifactor sp.]